MESFWHAGFFFWRAETWLGWLDLPLNLSDENTWGGLAGPFPAEPAPAEYPSDVLASVQVERARGPRSFWAAWLLGLRGARVHRGALGVLLTYRGAPAVLLTLLLLFALPAAAQRFERPSWAARGQACAAGRHRNTRAEVLASQCSLVSWSSDGCRVRTAVCVDAYTGAEVATDSAAQALQVDHLLPASVAWKRGTWHTREEMLLGGAGSRCTTPAGCSAYLAFFNDSRNLNVTRARSNRRKSDLMPGQWCPGSAAVRPVIARQFRAVATAYRIPLTPSELASLRAWDRGVCR